MPVLFAKHIQNSPSPVYLIRDFPELPDVVKGYIPGELSFAANSSELRANSPAVRRHLYSAAANVRRSTPNVRRSSAEFARVRPGSPVLRRELANGSPENSFAGRNPDHL